MDTRQILLFLGLLAAAGNAVAGGLFRCETPEGSARYSRTPIVGLACSQVGKYTVPDTPQPAVAVQAPKPAAPVPRGKVKGQIYSYEVDGVRRFSSALPADTASVRDLRTIRYTFIETCFACAPLPAVNFGRLRLNRAAYRAEVSAAAREFGVDEAVVRAIMHAESSFNPTALSRAGAQGLMQLMPATARRFGVVDSFDASQNIRGGVQYLSWLLKRYNGNITLAAAGYNAGEGAVDRYRGVPPYNETRRYVQRVGLLVDRYRTME
jgi:soluble lytic murein transglycosylase-like protein